MKRALFVLLLAFPPHLLAWGTPAWVKEAAKMPLPAYPAATPGVVLLDDTATTVRSDGGIEIVRRRAFRILNTEGRDLGYTSVAFNSLVQLASFHAWSITATGDEWEVKEREAMEFGRFDESVLYADEKMKVIKIPGAEPGTVVAFEYITRERSPQILQDSWIFQRELPVRSGRYTLALPQGWTHDERWINAEPKEPHVGADGLTWEVADVPAIPKEIGQPPMQALAGRLTINFYPPNQHPPRRSWNDFGVWYNGMVAQRRSATPELRVKAIELTAGKTAKLDKISALTAFAQKDVRYVAIEIGVGRYQPHAAGDIFVNRYGDCKDKVTVLSAMLQIIGVDSYYVITTTVRGAVNRQFASLDGFNHAIIAIRLPEEVQFDSLHAVVHHPKLGRLLLFDPTSSTTRLGDLPENEQQSEGLLVTDGGGELIDFPLLPPETNQLQRTAKLQLDEAGALSGAVTEVSRGSIAASLRGELQALTNPERMQFLERQVSYHLADFKIQSFVIENLDNPDKDLVMRYSFAAPSYAKHTGALVLVRARVIGGKVEGVLDLKERRYGYRTEGASLQVDEIEIAVPPSLTLDELPEKRTVNTSAIAYDSVTTFDAGVLHYRRQYRMKECDVPVGRLAELDKAFAAILADERSSAVFTTRSKSR